MSRIPSQLSVRLDVAVDRALVEPIDAATRAELQSLQAVLQGKKVDPEGIDPPSLVSEVFTFIMPRLSNPGVLRLERRRLRLERLEARANAHSHDNPLVSGGLMALRHELQNLTLLRQNRDSLIGG